MQSIDSKERYAYGRSKDLEGDKEEIKCNNIIKRYKKMINFDDCKRKQNNIIQIGHKFLITHTEY